jgi:O-antigen ligase
MNNLKIENITYLLLCIFCMLLPLFPAIIPVCIILIALSVILNFKNLHVNKIHIPLFYLSLFFYILHAVSFIYSISKKEALFDSEVKLSILVWPIIFLFVKPLNFIKYHNVLLSYIAGCIFSTFILIYNGIACYWEHGWIECFSGSYISPNFHTTYIAVYYIFCIAILMHLILKNIELKLSNIHIPKYVYVLLIIYFLVFIVQLQSKGAFISLLAILGINMFVVFKKSEIRYKKNLFVLIIISVIIPFLFSSNLRDRFSNSFSVLNKPIAELIDDSNKTKDGSAARKIAWYVAINKAFDNPWGYGSGSVKKILTDEYIKLNWKVGQEMYINAHNQYLQTLLSVGIQGLLILIVIIIYLLHNAVKSNNLLLLNFTIIFALNFMFESMFELQAGIVYIWFFICMLNNYDHPMLFLPIEHNPEKNENR